MVGATRFERATSTTPILITQFLHHTGGSCNALLEPVCESAFLFPFPFCPISSYRLRTLLLDLLLDPRKSTLAGALSKSTTPPWYALIRELIKRRGGV